MPYMTTGDDVPPPVHVIMVIGSGYETRMLVRSHLMQELLQEGATVTLLAPPEVAPVLHAEFARPPTVTVRSRPSRRPRIAYHLTRWERTFAGRTLPVRTSSIYWRQVRVRHPYRHAARRILGPALTTGLGRLALWVDRQLVPGHRAPSLPGRRPSVVVVGSLGRSAHDVEVMRLAKRDGISTVCLIRSWDNLTAKEYLRERPDRLVVWNEWNRREAIELYGFDEGNVFVGGVPDYDCLVTRTASVDRRGFCAAAGLDPDRVLILLAGAGGGVCPDFLDDIVQMLLGAIDAGELSRPAQLLVRPHPNVYAGSSPGQGTEADLRRYESQSPRVRGDRPIDDPGRLPGDFLPDEAQHFYDALYHSDVVVNFFGTISLEAALINRPVVNIAFDGFKRRPYERSIRSHGDYTHFQPMIERGATRVATTPEQLIEHIDAYLADPQLDADNRRSAGYDLSGRSAGSAAARVAKLIVEAKLTGPRIEQPSPLIR